MTPKIKKLTQLLQRKNGTTSMEIIDAIGTVSPHSRLSDLKRKGWTIKKTPVKNQTYNRYTGTPPKGTQ
jgi:hypothetical protein